MKRIRVLVEFELTEAGPIWEHLDTVQTSLQAHMAFERVLGALAIIHKATLHHREDLDLERVTVKDVGVVHR